jgi:branched-chain amino acid transport system permease protein
MPGAGRDAGPDRALTGDKAVALLKRAAVPAAVIAFILTFPLWMNVLKDWSGVNFLLAMRKMGIMAMVALGLNLLIGYAGQISLGHAAFMGIGAYATAILSSQPAVNEAGETVRVGLGLSVYISIPLAVLITVAVALLIAPVLRLKGHYLALATLGFGAFVGVMIRQLEGLTGGNTGIQGIPNLPLPFVNLAAMKTQQLWRWEYYIIWGLVFLMILLVRNLVESRPGRALQALHHSEVAAETLGIDTSLYKIKVFALSAAIAGLAGAVFAHINNALAPSDFTLTLSVSLLVMVVVGGMASVWGSLAGAAFVVFLPELITTAIPHWLNRSEFGANIEDIIFGASVILVMVLMPSGLTRGISDFFRYRRNPFTNPFKREGGF